MSYGRSTGSSIVKRAPQRKDDGAQSPSERPLLIPPGYYALYGITPPKSVQSKPWNQGPPIPPGLLEYYGVVAPEAPEQATSSVQQKVDSTTATASGLPSTLTSAIQVKLNVAEVVPTDEAEAVHETARHGISGTGGSLPYLEQIQSSFGHYDVSGIRAHTDANAQAATRAMGAAAFATGAQVAFADSPSLHTAAHEAAHVIQQRAGVQLKGGVGAVGDIYEQHADLVADRVVRGQSAEALLDRFVGVEHGSGGLPESSAGAGAKMPSALPSSEDRQPVVVQASFISFAVKMSAKQASKAMLKKFIKEQIRDKISKVAIRKFTKQFAKEADDILGILEDPWWATAVGFIPIVGDAFDLARVPKQIAKAIQTAGRLEEKVKHILHIQGKRASELLPATLKRSESYAEELAEKTYAQLVELAASSERAGKMKKLIEQQVRLMEKL